MEQTFEVLFAGLSFLLFFYTKAEKAGILNMFGTGKRGAFFSMQQPTLVILAAGIGSRFGGLKQIMAVDDHGHAIIDYSLYDAYRAGFRRVVFIIKHEIEEDFKAVVGRRAERYFDVRYVYQQLDMLPAGYSVPAGRSKPWGTGHAALCRTKPEDLIRGLSPDRLTMLHIQDNDLTDDRHLLPYLGELEWKPVTDALREIGYRGSLNFEALKWMKKFPTELFPAALRLLAETARLMAAEVEKG